jgi:hypothetical protein
MTVAIMQPYFLPYIGYFQLMKAVDLFVFYDDVNFIKQGWINRNRILLNGEEFRFTLELKGAGSFRKINEIEVGNNRRRLLKTVSQAYCHAPLYKKVRPICEDIFSSLQNNLSRYLVETLELIADYLKIETKFLVSSEIEKNNLLKGQDKVIEICSKLGASAYVNSIGGQSLYSKTDFMNAGINLLFLQSLKVEYKQVIPFFIPGLSILDTMMFNTVEEIQVMLAKYELI